MRTSLLSVWSPPTAPDCGAEESNELRLLCEGGVHDPDKRLHVNHDYGLSLNTPDPTPTLEFKHIL